MKFEYDSRKNLGNLKRHGLDFGAAQKLWETTHVIIPAKNVVGESRSAIVGKIGGKVYVGIYAERADSVRMISCHRADKKWEKIFYDYLKKTEK